METVTVTRFDGGKADDIYAAGVGEFSISKHFDTLTYPNRLYPLRGMTADTANTGIGNVIIGSDNNFYGIGGDYLDSAPTNGAIWKRTTGWAQFTHTSADPINYNLLVEYHDSSANRLIIHATANNKVVLVRMDDSAISSHSLTFANIAQGVVHPDDDVLYIPYDNKIAANNNGTWNDTAFVAPANYRITGVRPEGAYLAIALTSSVNGVDYGGPCFVYLWGRDTSQTTVTQSIDWGTGVLKYLGNLDDVLIGIHETGGNSSNIRDRDSIQIGYFDGVRSVPILEISTDKQTSTTPSVTINPRVNFKHNKRLYFSIDIDGGDTSPSYHGLWSIGKSKLTGRYSVNLERMATNDGSETSVIAAAISGDVACIVYNSEGTLAISNSTTGTDAQYTATSVHESAANPEMPTAHLPLQKQLAAFVGHYVVPLPSGAQVTAQYRVDGGNWKTIFTETTAGAVVTETQIDANGDPFVQGRKYEFRLTSTGYAQILGYSYKYDPLQTLI